MLSQAIACVHVQPPFFYPGSHRRRFFLRTTRLRIVGLIDEISTKRTHIKEKIREVTELSHLVVLNIFETINVLMTVDASCRLLLLFLSGSWQESMLWRTLR